MTTTAPPGMSFAPDVIAGLALAAFPHFLCWHFERVPGRPKLQKVPKSPQTGRNASTVRPADWAPLDVAVGRALREGWGVGFVFHATLNPFAGLDLDGARDPDTGTLAPWAESIIAAFDSYTEVSPSGSGVKIVVIGKPPRNGKKTGTDGTAVEVYGTGRYFTLTGRAPLSRPIRHGQATLNALCARLWPPTPPQAPRAGHGRVTADDATLLERARAARNGALFSALWNGHWQDRYGSQSEADLALVALLTFWCGGDLDRVDRLFRQSALYRPKWDRVDYRRWTLTRACGGRA